MNRTFAGRLGVLVISVVLLITCLWLFSPYGAKQGFDYKLIRYSIRINAPADSVFHFLGNSANAARWSVFVDHIAPLNAAAVPDGAVGSQRRCYCRADQRGRQWDEVVTQVEPGVRRQIRCYHLVGFPLSSEKLVTEQLYTSLAPGSTELSFTLFYGAGTPPSWLDELKIHVAAYYVQYIFRRNMNNIKKLVEFGGK